MAAKQNTLWFGYLDAGAKGSPVVRDHSLDTGTERTIYLFNLAKGRIVEYRRDIAEPKLRELTDSESESLKELRDAFKKARNSFTPRVTLKPPRRQSKPEPEPEPEPEFPDFEADDDLPPPDDDEDDAEDAVDLD
jgi:hypothetical protein